MSDATLDLLPFLNRPKIQSFYLNNFDRRWRYTEINYAFVAIIFYLITIYLFQPSYQNEQKLKQEKLNEKLKEKELKKSNANYKSPVKKLGAFEYFMILHNIGLCIFSLLTFLYTAPIIFSLWNQYGYFVAFSKYFPEAYSGTYGDWSHLFYLSKYYEFIDTWIIIAKGRRPSTLQVYHHCGAVLGMWMIQTSRCAGGFWFVCMNSFVHTIMYGYYAYTIMGYRWKSKYLLTTLQITQLIVGTCNASGNLIFYNNVMTTADIICNIYHVLYLVPLVTLFIKFFVSSYCRSNKKNNKNKTQ